MSSSIWTRCGARSSCRALRLAPWRVVEAQHLVSTRRLVDSDDEQRLLEELLDASKPPTPADAGGLHYLLFTPFRYPPLRYGSRFGTRVDRGIWYGSESRATAFAEAAFYRLVFLADTAADLGPLHVGLTVFQARVATERGVDLCAPPFDAHAEAIASRTSYAATQPLGAAMRADGVEAFRFPSARCPAGGANVAVLAPAAFARPRPSTPEAWDATVGRDAVEVTRRTFFADQRRRFRFVRAQFEVDGRLPVPPS